MPKTVGIGLQDFRKIRDLNAFYIDKTKFIPEWWESKDEVTLITRPRRFGKTLMMSTVENFFSVDHADGSLFESLEVWNHMEYRQLQGTYPVIMLSFSDIKENSYQEVRSKICESIVDLYNHYDFLARGELLNDREKEYFYKVSSDMPDSEVSISLRRLSGYLYKYYGKKTIILLDEYDTPVLEAYTGGYWNELVTFTRSFFNATFKNNPYLERAILTGITRISKESIFSDLNNLKVVTTTSEEYADCFGFTEDEVFSALEEYGMSDQKQEVKNWYDGFTFGSLTDIYNPWSIINFLDTGKFQTYWANTSSNHLANELIQRGSKDIKTDLRIMFENMIHGWFADYDSGYNDFVRALLQSDLKAMNVYMNRVAVSTFSFFDTGRKPSQGTEPERFYHGFVLGLIVELEDRYSITSNRESGFGRYDVILEPYDTKDNAFIMEFKVRDPEDEKDLSATVQSALGQIDDKKYDTVLSAKGFPAERIRKYGFAFQGKKVLIGCE